MMRSMKDWLSLRPWQRHSLVLLVGGMVYITFGITLLTVVDVNGVRERTWAVALQIMTIPRWGVLFILGGILAMVSSKWPQFSDKWGYSVLTGLAAGWAATYFLSYWLFDAPATNISLGLNWALTAFMWWAISGLINPDRRAVRRHERS